MASSTGNWSNTANWSNTSGGAGGFSVPGPGDAVTFNGARVGNCIVDVNPGTINGITILAAYTGSINLNGFNLTTAGGNSFAGGTINGAASTLTLATTGTSTFSGTTFNVPITGTSGRFTLNGGTYNAAVSLTKTGAGDDDGTGNNTFASTVSLQNNTANRIRLATSTRDIFNGTLTVTTLGSGIIDLAYGSVVATQFNDNIIINFINNSPVRFGASVGVSVLATGKTVTINPGAGGAGSLTLGGITFQSGQTLALTGSTNAIMTVRNNATFNGTTSLLAPTYSIGAGKFNGPLTIEKTGASSDDLAGGNTYGSTVNIINSGDGQFNFANTNPDTFNGAVTINNTAGGRVQIGINSAGNVINGTLTVNHGGSTAGINCIFARNIGSTLTINGNVFLNQSNADASSGIIVGNQGKVTINGNITMTSNNGRGILFANSAESTVTIGANGNNYSLIANTTDFIFGTLSIQNTIQLGTATQTVNLGGTSVFNIGSANEFNGPVDFRARGITVDSSNFKNSAIIEKTGSGDNGGSGGATFAGPTTLRNSGSGIFYNSGNNTFNGTTTIESTGSNYISFDHNRGSVYNGPVTYNNTGSSYIRAARSGSTSYNDNIVVNSSGGNGILFCETAAPTSATLAAGKTITTSGFTAGELRLKQFTQQGTTAQNLTLIYPGTGQLTLGPASTFGGNVTFSAPRVFLNGTTFNGTSDITKTGASNDNGTGGNTFTGATTIANSGSAVFSTANNDPDTFNGVLTVNNSGSSTIRFSDNVAGNAFNNNIILNTSAGTGIYFGNSGGSSVLADNRTISAGTVLAGDIRLMQFVQNSSINPQVLDLDGIAILTLGPSSKFGGNVDFRSPQLYLNGCTYGTTAANTARLEKKGATENIGNGGNVFNSVTTIINSGSNSLRSANVQPDIFNANLTVNNTSSAAVTLSYTVAGNQYNGNITVSNTLGGVGVTFGSNGGSSTMSPTGVLAIGPAGFVSGDLRFARFTQTGTLLQTLILTPPAAGTARLRLGPNSAFGGEVNFRSPRVLLEGCTFGGVAYIEKTGATDDASAGGNVFNGVTTIANSGTGWFINGDAVKDQFNNNLTLTNTGSAGIRMADNIPGNEFKGNIVVNSTFGSGIYFCESNAAASAELADTKTITVGALGFTTGDLRIRRFTVVATVPQALTFTGTAGMRIGPGTVFNGDVNFKAPQMYINQAIYNGTATLEKSGATDNTGTGGSTFMSTTSIKVSGAGYLRTNAGHVFNGATTLTNSGSNDMILELVSGSTYNQNVAMVNSGSSSIRSGYQGTTDFNGNITVSSVSGTGILFGETATNVNLADTKTITVAGNFTAGELRFSHFNQMGSSTPQALTLTGSASLTFNLASTFGSNITTSSPRLFLSGATFSGVNSFTKTNTSNDDSSGGNTFVGATTVTNSGTGRVRLANSNPDSYSGAATFVRSSSSSGALDVAYSGNNTFAGNITTNSNTAITFGGNTGVQTFTGTAAQLISRVGAGIPLFNRLVMNKASGAVSLATGINIGVSATFTSGNIIASAGDFPIFANGATASGASNASYVSGPVRKIGVDPFIFPVGKNNIYKPIAVGTRGAAGDQFTAEYFNAVQTAGNVMGPGLDHVSACEHWRLDRTNGTSQPTVTLSWKNSECPGTYVVNTADLRVASYNAAAPARWEDRGNGGVTAGPGGLPDEGTIVSSAGVNVFGFFALATSTASNPLPIELLSFSAANMGAFVHLTWTTATERNNDYFNIQRSTDGAEFSSIARIAGAGTSTREIDYQYGDESPLAGVSYYRLKQTDFDGKVTYSKVVKVDRDSEAVLMVYPNPASVATGMKTFTNIKGSFTIYNSVGLPVLSKENSNEFDVSGLAAGVYLVRSASGQVCRLVIN